MKTLYIIAVALLMTVRVFAQSPEKMSYQAIVRNGSNALVTSATVGMRISILQGSASGTAVYVETQTPNSNANGLVSLEIGSGTVISGNFTSIDWANGLYFIKTETDPTGGTSYTVTGTRQLMSVPYALYAKTSGNGVGPQGPAGNDGAAGATGLTGATGPQGPIGLTGPAGANGATGSQGPIGLTGPQGIQGLTGSIGATGLQGPIGLTGANGIQGPAGTNGSNGINGSNGLSAYQIWLNAGNSGTETQFLNTLQGATGSQGAIGLTGAPGPQGIQGSMGATGAQGIQGVAGPTGAIGSNGADGKNTIVKTTTEAAGANCATGGTKVEVGLDTNSNGVLDTAEINATLTKYVCNGLIGATGAQGIQGSTGPADGAPAATIISWSGPLTTTITGPYLLCDGSNVSRTTYSELFSVIGTTYGTGDGINTFTLPNIQSRVISGYNSSDSNFNSIGLTGGTISNTLVANNLPTHTHSATTTVSNLATTSITDPGHSHLLVYGGTVGANRSVYGDYLLGGPINIFTPPVAQANTASAVSGPAVAATTTTGISASTTVSSTATTTVGNNSTTNTAVTNLQPYIVMRYYIKYSAGNTAIGVPGPQGIPGPQGLQGPAGSNGIDGLDGVDGAIGPQGPQGPAGIAGTNGISINWLGTLTAVPINPSINDAYYNSTEGKSFIWNGAWVILAKDGTATTATNVAITEDNTSSVVYPVFVSDNTGNLALKVDKTATPLSYTPSTGELRSQSFAATNTNGTVFSRLSSTQLQVADVPSNIVTITSNQISVGPNSSDTKITPTSVTATSFVTDTAPAGGNQLGNKTYIDNFGGSGGWYFTTTVSVAASTVVDFPNCLNNTYNAYEIYFVPNLTAPNVGYYPSLDMTFSGITTPTYQSWNQTQTTQGSSTNSYATTAPRLLDGFNFNPVLNRQATIKLDLWGTRNISGGSSGSRFTYLSEGFSAANPGITAWIKSSGTVAYSSGSPTGITFTYSAAVTGSITIIVKSKY